MAEHSAGADIAFLEILGAINDDSESQMEPATSDTVDLSLAELYNRVQRKVEVALDQMKEPLKSGQVDLDLYLRLNDALLALQHWSDDIIVQNDSPLATIENDIAGFEVLAVRLRVHFNDMLRILPQLQEHADKSSSEIEIKTEDELMDGLEQLIDHLKNFVNPLRTFLEAKINVGKVAAVREAATAQYPKDAPTTSMAQPAPGYSFRAVSGEASTATPLSAAWPVVVKSGRQKLSDLVNGLRQIHDLVANTYPIVLVAGFASFGDPLFGSINYWGGFEDLASSLQAHTGVPVILPRIGPFSSNWERACELYSQLCNIQSRGPGAGFDTRATSPPTSIAVDYGQYIPLPTLPASHSTKQAVLLGTLPGAWKWGPYNPVHMICHSQGGNTVRLLIELLSGKHGARNPAYFGAPLGNRQEWVRSVVTLGTPYLGTTITNVIFDEMLRDVQVDEVISSLVVSASLNPGRFVDLQLDHWGFAPLPGENFLGMHTRLRTDIGKWWTSDNNAVKDNGIAGIARLNADFSPSASADTYYFTMSFDATRPFPTEHLLGQDLENLPVHPLLSFGGLVYPGPFNITANLVSDLFKLGRNIPGTPSAVAYARWAVGLVNNYLRMLGYQIRVPSPGGRIPRADMLPALSIFSIGMSGMSKSSGLSEQNDGVVDTSSMRAPAHERVQDIDNFNTACIETNRGVYWDLGLTEGIDHADEVGVFTVAATYGQVLQIYQQLGDLLSAL